jgi:hypothetical protein
VFSMSKTEDIAVQFTFGTITVCLQGQAPYDLLITPFPSKTAWKLDCYRNTCDRNTKSGLLTMLILELEMLMRAFPNLLFVVELVIHPHEMAVTIVACNTNRL